MRFGQDVRDDRVAVRQAQLDVVCHDGARGVQGGEADAVVLVLADDDDVFEAHIAVAGGLCVLRVLAVGLVH